MPLCATAFEAKSCAPCRSNACRVDVDADAALFYKYRDVLLKLRRDEVRAMGRQYEREMKRASADLGLRKKSAELSVQVTTTSLLTEVVTVRSASDALLVIHPHCLAVYRDVHMPVPAFRIWMDKDTTARLSLDPAESDFEDAQDADTTSPRSKASLGRGRVASKPGSAAAAKKHRSIPQLLIEGKTRPDSAANNIAITIRPPAIAHDDGASLPPTVLLTEWHGAIQKELPQPAPKKPFGLTRKGTVSNILSKALEADDDEADDRARAAARKALPAYFKKIIGPYELRAFWFEIFECARKISLIGLPVFFDSGSTSQLILGLLICTARWVSSPKYAVCICSSRLRASRCAGFLSFGAYMMLSPYIKEKHDYVSQVRAQVATAHRNREHPACRGQRSGDALWFPVAHRSASCRYSSRCSRASCSTRPRPPRARRR